MEVVAGTAHLFALADEATSRRLLEAAWDAGVRRFDTAPLYGGGRSELALGALLADRDGVLSVTTKTGLEPRTGRRSARQLATGVARRLLPTGPAGALDAALDRRATRATGRFRPADVRTSVERSLRRLGGRVDRLLLHEVSPHDVDEDLLGVLRGLVDAGDVGAVGVATANRLTAAAVGRGHGLLTVVHHEVGPLAPPVDLPPSVLVRVGHGLLGGGGSHLAALHRALEADVRLAGRWRDTVRGTPFDAPGGLAEALLARAALLPVDEVLVATTQPSRLPRTVTLARGDVAVPAPVVQVLDEAVAAARA
ncbi:aldo/keto reductase [uncultured Pseudokineococcus sp.]|uniref:aldo/keto reductase n=1 Tax=uncultured Pseudokineococcus sp. TaxID=1642928 RepID=UPI002627D407|nr:aldo/keto reductase [uncultured Pseudokineococcus sp.]